jgi:hypothetical protein
MTASVPSAFIVLPSKQGDKNQARALARSIRAIHGGVIDPFRVYGEQALKNKEILVDRD